MEFTETNPFETGNKAGMRLSLSAKLNHIVSFFSIEICKIKRLLFVFLSAKVKCSVLSEQLVR